MDAGQALDKPCPLPWGPSHCSSPKGTWGKPLVCSPQSSPGRRCPQAGAGDRKGDVWSLRAKMTPVPVPPTQLGWPCKDRDHSPPPLLQMPPFPALPTGTVPTKALQICQCGRAARHPQLGLFWGPVRNDGCCERCTPALLPHSRVSQPHPTLRGKQDVVPARAAGTPPLGNESLSSAS